MLCRQPGSMHIIWTMAYWIVRKRIGDAAGQTERSSSAEANGSGPRIRESGPFISDYVWWLPAAMCWRASVSGTRRPML